MENSRSSTPEAPPENLWSSILDSVSSSRSLPTKQILLLGQPSTGKSTIASALLQRAAPSPEENKGDQRIDFALGYDFTDVRDDGDEGAYGDMDVISRSHTQAWVQIPLRVCQFIRFHPHIHHTQHCYHTFCLRVQRCHTHW